MRKSNRRSSGLSALAVVTFLFAGFSSLAVARDSWHLYSSPLGDFKIMMPAPVKISKKTLGHNVTSQNFEALGDETRTCLISCELQNDQKIFERFANGAKSGITQKGGTILSTRDVDGPGWSGHLYDYSVKGNSNNGRSSLLVAKVDDSGRYYTIAMNAPSDANEAKSVYSSFEVSPSDGPAEKFGHDKKKGTNSDAKPDEDDNTSSSDGDSESKSADSEQKSARDKDYQNEPGYQFGKNLAIALMVGFGICILLVPLIAIAVIVFVVNRRDRVGK